MPPLRLHPLLIAGAACLTLAACGSDDDPPPQAGAPAAQTQTNSASDTGPSDAPADSPTPGDAKPDGTSKTEPDATPSPLDGYVVDGGPATKRQTTDIRATLIGYQEAIGRRDVVAVCNLTVGLPVESSAKSPMSCRSLTEDGLAEPLTDENRRLIGSAKIVVGDDNKATAELIPGFKMPLQKIDGSWRIDYGAVNEATAASR